MAITAEYYSTQGAKIAGTDFEMLRPYDHYGRRRVCFFDYVVPAGGLADGSNLFVAKLPAGARILGGEINTDALGTGAQIDVGLAGFDGSGFIDAAGTVADDDDLLGAAIDAAAAGVDEFASVLTENYGYLTEKAVWLVLTTENAAWDADAIIKGSIEFVVD